MTEDWIEAEKRKKKELFDLVDQYRAATEAGEVKRLGDELGRMIFGSTSRSLPR